MESLLAEESVETAEALSRPSLVAMDILDITPVWEEEEESAEKQDSGNDSHNSDLPPLVWAKTK